MFRQFPIPLARQTACRRICTYPDCSSLVGQQPYDSSLQQFDGPHITVGTGFRCCRNTFKDFCPRIETEHLIVVCQQPDKSVLVFVHVVHTVVGQCNAVVRTCLISLERISVELVDAVPRGKPHIPLLILQDRHDGILRKPILGRVMGEQTIGMPAYRQCPQTQQASDNSV